MDFRVFSRNISENMHARCVREDTKQALKGNLQADGVQSRQTLFVRYCLKYVYSSVSEELLSSLSESEAASEESDLEESLLLSPASVLVIWQVTT